MRILVFLSSILVTLLAHAGSYDVQEIVDKNPGLTQRFDFIKKSLVNRRLEFFDKIHLDRKVTIAVIGDYIHTDTFQHLIHVNSAEIPDNGIDDDNNGFVDDYLGINMNTHDGRLSTPVASGHENGIVSLLDALITDNKLEKFIQVLPINVTSDKNRFDELYFKKVADGIDYAVMRGAQVISMSIGVSEHATAFFEFIDKDKTKSLAYYEAAVQRATRAGVILVASVSNDPNKDQSKEKEIPSHTKGILSVANVNFDNEIQSAYGANVDVAFYGTGINVWNGEKQGYRTVKGTSFSTPLVSLAAAITKIFKPALNVSDLDLFRLSCDGPIQTKKNIRSRCVFSPEKLVLFNLLPNARSGGLLDEYGRALNRGPILIQTREFCAPTAAELVDKVDDFEHTYRVMKTPIDVATKDNLICAKIDFYDR